MRVRWDRAGRSALLIVLVIVAALSIQRAITLLQTHSQAQQQLAIVQQLAKANHRLIDQQRSLNDPATIQRDARALGMVRPGERPYVITGLPNH